MPWKNDGTCYLFPHNIDRIRRRDQRRQPVARLHPPRGVAEAVRIGVRQQAAKITARDSEKISSRTTRMPSARHGVRGRERGAVAQGQRARGGWRRSPTEVIEPQPVPASRLCSRRRRLFRTAPGSPSPRDDPPSPAQLAREPAAVEQVPDAARRLARGHVSSSGAVEDGADCRRTCGDTRPARFRARFFRWL